MATSTSFSIIECNLACATLFMASSVLVIVGRASTTRYCARGPLIESSTYPRHKTSLYSINTCKQWLASNRAIRDPD